jgi:hypothetical protein
MTAPTVIETVRNDNAVDRPNPLSQLRTGSVAWFGIAGALVRRWSSDTCRGVQEVDLLAALFVFFGACIRALGLSVRDDEVSSASIRDPTARALAMMGADSATARRRRRLERERLRAQAPATTHARFPSNSTKRNSDAFRC